MRTVYPPQLRPTALVFLALLLTALRAQAVDGADPGGRPAVATADDHHMNGSLDVGGLHDSLSGGYPAWNGGFVRGVVHTSKTNTVNFEINELREFGDHGTLFVAGDTADLNDDWFASLGVQASAGGFFLPRDRADLAVNRKWLADRRLITTLGLSAINAKDVHRDRAVELASAYYFSVPLVLEAGVRLNRGQPGNVHAPSRFAAATFGKDKSAFVSLRYGSGTESYQLVGVNSTLVDFQSRSVLLTWRQWFGAGWGTQLRGEHYSNPGYRRDGLEAGVFLDF